MQCLTNLLYGAAQAGAALPLVILAALLITRRGHVFVAFTVSAFLAHISSILAFFGIFSLVADIGVLIAQMQALGQAWVWPDPFDPALLSYRMSFLFWLLSALLAFFLRVYFQKKAAYPKDTLPLFELACPLLLTALLGFFFFAAFFCLFWPFSGLPQGMTFSQALLAVLAHTWHLYFFSLFPAGLFALAFLPIFAKKNLPKEKSDHLTVINRLFAACALIGALPRLLSHWGTIVGYLFRTDTPFAIYVDLAENTAFTVSLMALLVLALGKMPTKTRYFRWAAFASFLIGICLPALFLLKRHF